MLWNEGLRLQDVQMLQWTNRPGTFLLLTKQQIAHCTLLGGSVLYVVREALSLSPRSYTYSYVTLIKLLIIMLTQQVNSPCM